MRTTIIIFGGLVLLGLFLLAGWWSGGNSLETMIAAAQAFIPTWLAAAACNMWVGVKRAGYTVAQEFPIFLVISGIPVAMALFAWWRLS